MTDYAAMPLDEARRRYRASSTMAMPVAGLMCWGSFAMALVLLPRGALPPWAVFMVPALPLPLALALDAARGALPRWSEERGNPVAGLFLSFITVVALLIPFVVIAARAAGDRDLLILGLGILSGLVWVPYGWGADDPAGFRHFIARAVLCYAAYLLVPDALRGAAIAGAVAVTYVYAIAAMKRPSAARGRATGS